MLREIARNYYLNGNYNCAETVLLAANDEYKLGLTENEIKLIGGFGAGMGCRKEACGALSGAIAALSKLRITTKAHETDGFPSECAALVSEFEKKLGDTCCFKLAAKYKTKEARCLETILLGCDVLEEHLKTK